ncbi:DUF5984 family protein [Micromonosporaceae bacterium DT194]|uniref:DUF5984 family protein n=1 Tax=Melissospora conviva TaxID=3388432 RepID=UPI003C1950CE
MIKFRFELYRLDEVSSWGGDRPVLHWFGLTEGWYWLEASGQELLRRTRQVDPHPYIDYYLARFWEDVMALSPVRAKAASASSSKENQGFLSPSTAPVTGLAGRMTWNCSAPRRP